MPEIFNPVRRRLAAGEPVFAITLTVPSVEIAAQAAHMGFDFLWIEMEHSPITLETLRSMVLATRGAPAAAFARVPVNELWTAKRVLDAGVQGVMFPQHAGAGAAGSGCVPLSSNRPARIGARTGNVHLA
jgi:2-keto-3-deoxy-L-rhamnonate aldolase RhmA